MGASSFIVPKRIFTRKLQSKHGNFLFFRAGQKIFLLIISDLKNISKIIAQTFAYIIYIMYICTINLKQEQKWNTQQHQLTHFYKQSKIKQNGFQKRQTRALFQRRI